MLPAPSFCCKSGSTRPRIGKLCQSRSRNASWDALSSTASNSRNKLDDSHVARTDQDEFGHIFRRNMPYGTIADHGTMFVGFSADQKRLSRMLDSMAGLITGTVTHLRGLRSP